MSLTGNVSSEFIRKRTAFVRSIMNWVGVYFLPSDGNKSYISNIVYVSLILKYIIMLNPI